MSPSFRLYFLSYNDKFWAAAFCIVSGIIAMLATRFNDIAVISIGPLRAELRKEITEARETLKETKKVSAITAKAALALVQYSGRMGGLPDSLSEDIYETFCEILDDLGIDREPVEKIWHDCIEYDYGSLAIGRRMVPHGATNEEIRRWKNLNKTIGDRATPDQLRSFLNDTRYMTPEREELIADLEHYIEHRKHRRPDVWAKRADFATNNQLIRDK